jgi:hypothetical protein
MRADSRVVTCLLFPLLGMILQILVKLLTKRNPTFERTDFDVGFESTTTAFITFAGLAVERALDWVRTDRMLTDAADAVERARLEAHLATLQTQVSWAFLGMLGITIVLLGLAVIVRNKGTEVCNCGHDERTCWVGAFLPDCVGFLALSSVALYFST